MIEFEETLKNLEESAKLLDLDEKEREKFGADVISYIRDFWTQLPNVKGYEGNCNNHDTGRISDFRVQEEGRSLEELLTVFESGVNAVGVNSASGRHLGNIPSGGLPAAAYGDFIAAATNKHSGLHSAAPGAVDMENCLLEWAAGVFGFDVDVFGGNLTSGGSLGNLISFVAARDAKGIRGRDYETAVVYCSDQVHYCIPKALKFLGMGECVYRSIPSDARFRIETPALEAQIQKDVMAALRPFVIVGTAGTTNSGCIDDLQGLSRLAHKFGCWFHVDAAYGGFFFLLDAMKEKFKGISEADSLVIDPHKGLFLPFGSGMVLVKDRNHLLQSNCYTAPYIHYDAEERKQRQWSPVDLSPELTKPFRGLRLWLPLMYHGLKPFKKTLEEKLLLAQYVYEKLDQMEFIEVGPAPELSVVIFRFRAAKEEDLNRVNEAVIRAIHDDGSFYFTTTNIHDAVWQRVCILSFRTHRKEVDDLVALIQDVWRRINGKCDWKQS